MGKSSRQWTWLPILCVLVVSLILGSCNRKHTAQPYSPADGEQTYSFVVPTDYHYDYNGGWPYGYQHTHLYTDSNYPLNDSIVVATGHGSSAGYDPGSPNWDYSGNWLATYNAETRRVRRICFPCNADMLSYPCIERWSTSQSQGYQTTAFVRYCPQGINEYYVPQDTSTVVIPIAAGPLTILHGPYDSFWVATKKNISQQTATPFCAARVGTSIQYCVAGDNAPAAVEFAFDNSGNLVVLGYQSTLPPFQGVRLEVISGSSGMLLESAIVSAFSEAKPASVMMFEDNTPCVISTILNGESWNLVVSRLDTIPTGTYVPLPATIELVVEGPPAWGYRFNTGTYSQDQIILDNVCARATASLSGSAQDNWNISHQNSRVTFSAIDPVTPETSIDTLWLIAPECLEGTISWTCGSFFGEIDGPYMPDGPYFPQGYAQQFFCRLEQTGVSVRFAVTGAPDMDVLKVWRKRVGSEDSTLVGMVGAIAGSYVLLDNEVPRGQTFVYYLLATDDFGRVWRVPDASDTIFVDGSVFVPTEFSLSPAYPNPFNAVTNFDYAVPYQSNVSFRVYDITGRQVATLVDEFKEAGVYRATFDASGLGSGVYVYSFEAWQYSQHGKVLLLK